MSESSANTPVSTSVSAPPSHPVEFGRTAMAILVTMVLLIVALTGILVETTWRQPAGEIEALPADPGSFAQR
jgi:hypothetical protein